MHLRQFTRVVFLLALAFSAAAQDNPPDVTFQLRLKEGKTQYRIGERIQIELLFSSPTPETYQVDLASYDRSGRLGMDKFVLTPEAGFTDPMRDYFQSLTGWLGGGLRSVPVLTEKPVSVVLDLNEWIRFDEPGTYQLRITTPRAARLATRDSEQPHADPFSLTSNEVTLNIVAADAAWQEQTLREALAMVQKRLGANNVDRDEATACRTIRFLGTPAAVREMVARIGEETRCSFDWMAGLFGSPHRELVIEEMERQLASPWQAVSGQYLWTLARLSFAKEHPEPLPAWPDKDPQRKAEVQALYQQRHAAQQAHYEAYVKKLWELLPSKRDPARAAVVHTLFGATQASGSAKSLAALRPALAAMMPGVLPSLPPDEAYRLIAWNWRHIADPALLPVLREIYQNPPKATWGQLRDIALLRIYQLAPSEGRQLILAEMRRLEPRVEMGVLRMLPDATIKEMNETLAGNLEEARRKEIGDAYTKQAGLIERYADGSILERVKAIWVGPPRPFDVGKKELLAYFLRVDPEFGLREIRAEVLKPCDNCYRELLPHIARLHTNAGLETLATELLDHSDEGLAADAAEMLGQRGSADAKPALFRRMAALHKMWKGREHELRWINGRKNPNEGAMRLESKLQFALGKARSWVLSSEETKKLHELCLTPQCRQNTDQLARDSISINYNETGYARWSVGDVSLDSFEAVLEKLAQYPARVQWRWTVGQALAADENQRLLAQVERLAAARGTEITIVQ